MREINLEERMPKTKNQAKNRSRFEVRGGILNEYEFERNEEAMAEEERNRLAQMEEAREVGEGEEGASLSPQEREAARIREVMETAHEKAQRNLEKRKGHTGGARKGARKRASKAGAGKKAGGRKSGSAGSAKKGAQKRALTKGAKKSGGTKSATEARTGASRKRSARQGGTRKGASKKGSAKKAQRGGTRKRG